jgi:hypothetical protein
VKYEHEQEVADSDASEVAPVSGADAPIFVSRVWIEPPQPRFTFFHVLWLAGVVGTGVFAVKLTTLREWSLVVRATIVLASTIGGLLVFHLATFAFVIALVIPRLGRFTYWAYEVECYMLFVLGDTWRHAGKSQGDRSNSPQGERS